jgi:myosin heavy subunit
METIRIYQAGFPICHDFNQFVERFLILLQGVHLCEITEYREVSYQICTEVLHKRTGWQMGYTKVFLKMKRGFTCLKATLRARRVCQPYKSMRRRVIGFQCYCRGYIVRRRFSRILYSIVKIQALFRMIIAKRKVKLLKREKKKKEVVERLRRREEEDLRQRMREDEAKIEAETHHQERLRQIEEEKRTEEERIARERRTRVDEVRKKVTQSEARQCIPVEKIIQEMFTFLDGNQEKLGVADS